jgi:uncharacterized protein (DUF433 family)
MVTASKPQTYAHIAKSASVCGGQPTIDDTRVRVKNIALLAKQGRTPQQMLEDYPGLTLGQIHAALTYYYDHTREIEAAITADERAFEELNRYWREHVVPRVDNSAERTESALARVAPRTKA